MAELCLHIRGMPVSLPWVEKLRLRTWKLGLKVMPSCLAIGYSRSRSQLSGIMGFAPRKLRSLFSWKNEGSGIRIRGLFTPSEDCILDDLGSGDQAVIGSTKAILALSLPEIARARLYS